MNRAATFVLALGALAGAAASQAGAQVVIGEQREPNVVINWSVLDRLGPPPTLAGMLKGDVPVGGMRAQMAQPPAPAERITFQPYQEKKKPVAHKPRHVVAKEDKPVPVKAVAVAVEKTPAGTNPAEAKPAATKPVVAKAEPAPPPTAAQLPEPAAPAPVAAATETTVAKAEAAKPEAASEAKAAAAEAATTSAVGRPERLTPATAVAKAEPVNPEAKQPETAKPQLADAPPPGPAAAATPAAATIPAPAAQPAPQAEVASLPPAPPAPTVSAEGDTLTITFAAEAARMPDGVRPELLSLANKLKKDDGLGLQLLAYADGEDASKARRLSLSRALEVRKYLMDQGIRSTRIEVRALGTKNNGGPADRVDAVLVAR